MATTKPTTTKQPLYNKIDEAFGGNLPGGAKPAGALDPQIEADKQAQAACRAQGGQWDPSTRSCILPNAIKNQTETKAPETKNQDQIFRDQETGNISGVTIGGKTYLGLKPADVEKMASAQQMKQKGGPATQAFETGAIAQQQAAQQQVISQEAIANLGLNPTQIQAIQSGLVEAPIDYQQALTAGVANVLPSLVGGIVGGGAVGSLAGGIGAVPGAIAGGIGGLITGLFNGVLRNIKSQQSGEISASVDVLTNAKTNMRKLSSMAAKDPTNAAMYVEAYNMQLAQVYKAQAQIKLETNGNLNKFMEDGTDILSDFDLFLQPNGQAEIYRRQLELSLMTGVAPSLTVDDFANE